MLHAAGEGVVRAGEEALRLELDIGMEILRAVAHGARVAELDDHLPKQNAARVHIRHRQHVLCENKKGIVRKKHHASFLSPSCVYRRLLGGP